MKHICHEPEMSGRSQWMHWVLADIVQELDKKQKHEFKVYVRICTQVYLFIYIVQVATVCISSKVY